jgi:hypothetical protein
MPDTIPLANGCACGTRAKQAPLPASMKNYEEQIGQFLWICALEGGLVTYGKTGDETDHSREIFGVEKANSYQENTHAKAQRVHPQLLSP